MTTEDLYISLYEEFSPTAEYLQADSRDRAFLAETAILMGLAFALSAFVESFFGHLGEKASEHLLSRINGRLKISQEQADRSAMLEALELMGPFLKYLDEMTSGQRLVYQSAVVSALESRGYPHDVAEDTASQVIHRLALAGAAGLA